MAFDVKAYHKQYRAEHKDRINELHRAYYNKNKIKINNQQRAYRRENREHSLTIQRAWRNNNREHYNEYFSQWRKKNRLERRIYCRNWYRNKRGNNYLKHLVVKFEKNPTNTDIAYLAGLIDGDGWITILSKLSSSRFMMGVSNTDYSMVKWIQSIFGGYINYRKLSNKGFRDQWTWITYGRRAYEILKLIKKYLIVKRTTCDIAIQYAEECVLPYTGKFQGLDKMVPIHNEYVKRIRDIRSDKDIKFHHSKDREITEMDKAYAAGIFDAEGSICLDKLFQVAAIMWNSNEDLVNWFQ